MLSTVAVNYGCPPFGNFFAALSLSIGIGFTTASEIGLWHIFPEIIQNVFSANVVAVVFVASIVLNMILPENMEVDKISE